MYIFIELYNLFFENFIDAHSLFDHIHLHALQH